MYTGIIIEKLYKNFFYFPLNPTSYFFYVLVKKKPGYFMCDRIEQSQLQSDLTDRVRVQTKI